MQIATTIQNKNWHIL